MSIGTVAYRNLNNKSLYNSTLGVFRTQKVITNNSDIKISTAQSKFGGASVYAIKATYDYFSVASSSDFAWGANAFTYELWFRPTGLTGVQFLLDQRTQSAASCPCIYLSGATMYYYVGGVNRITASTAFANDTWYHVAIARSGTSTKLFINGTQEGSTWSDSTTYVQEGALNFFNTYGGAGSSTMGGYIDEVRVSKVARYTANFTPATAQFTNDSDTVLLIHGDGANNSTDINDYVR